MTEKTYNIIMACKDVGSGDITNTVKEYLSKECNEPISAYTQSVISDIMEVAMYDYIDSCDKPSTFLRFFTEWGNFYSGVSLGEKIAIAFRGVRVRDRNGNYINGFGEYIKGE